MSPEVNDTRGLLVEGVVSVNIIKIHSVPIYFDASLTLSQLTIWATRSLTFHVKITPTNATHEPPTPAPAPPAPEGHTPPVPAAQPAPAAIPGGGSYLNFTEQHLL
ncbi:hypothetical protein J6590_014060 [Homalodisca vitripennis]|nr:hypothetical protein J6590_014060 [Homalodisca vitripennis]